MAPRRRRLLPTTAILLARQRHTLGHTLSAVRFLHPRLPNAAQIPVWCALVLDVERRLLECPGWGAQRRNDAICQMPDARGPAASAVLRAQRRGARVWRVFGGLSLCLSVSASRIRPAQIRLPLAFCTVSLPPSAPMASICCSARYSLQLLPSPRPRLMRRLSSTRCFHLRLHVGLQPCSHRNFAHAPIRLSTRFNGVSSAVAVSVGQRASD